MTYYPLITFYPANIIIGNRMNEMVNPVIHDLFCTNSHAPFNLVYPQYPRQKMVQSRQKKINTIEENAVKPYCICVSSVHFSPEFSHKHVTFVYIPKCFQKTFST